VSQVIRSRRAVSWLSLAAFSVAMAVAFLTPSEAGAKRGITTGVAAPSDYRSLDASVRGFAFDKTAEANADLVRIDVLWQSVVGSVPPVSPRDPADPAYDFSRVDAAVREAQIRGLQVLFTVYSAPAWAEGPDRPDGLPAGVWRPDPGDYGNFASALAKRYSGSFSPAAGQPPLPQVRYFEAWNEPNLGDLFLAPQWVGDRAEGVAIYRGLLNSLYDAVHGVNPGNVVVGPGTSPFGGPVRSSDDRTRPVQFLRELFCLQGRRELKPQPCPPVRLDVLSHHALSHEHAPSYSAISPDDAATSDIDRVRRVLRAAEKAGVVQPGGKRPIWVSEFWWVTHPPANNAFAVSQQKQARYIAEALYRYWKQRVEVAIQYLIRDPGGDDPFQTGLFSTDGKEKRAFQAFRFPFVADRKSRKRVLAWGRSPTAGKLKIQGKKQGGWRTLKRLRVKEDEIFTARLRRTKRMRAQIGGEASLVWRQSR
jgi:hypothetical protein